MPSTAKLLSLLEASNFDVASGVELCGGDPAFYCDLIRELYEDVLPQGAALLSDADPGRQREFAHKLKGTLSTLGERSACETAIELEKTLRNGKPDPALAQRLRTQLENLQKTLAAAFA